METCKPSGDESLRCGTLVYTKRAMMVLFLWLIWGDICYTLMESVTAPIMLVKFQALGAMNWEIGLLLTTIPTAIYSILNPIISFKSDRYRSRFGRRIPFILFSLPMLVSSLVGLAFADRVGVWLHSHINGLLFVIDFTPQRYAIFTLAAMLLIFTFFNTFVTSTFWYLFNDVVPEKYLARFMSWFRVVAVLSASFYSIYIFPHSRTHSTEIFLGAAALYLLGFGLMCWRVREGKYDPPPPYVGGAKGPMEFWCLIYI